MNKVIELAKRAGLPTLAWEEETKAFYTLARADLEAENAKLREVNKMLDSALCRAYPNGCYHGDVFELWNTARTALGETK